MNLNALLLMESFLISVYLLSMRLKPSGSNEGGTVPPIHAHPPPASARWQVLQRSLGPGRDALKSPGRGESKGPIDIVKLVPHEMDKLTLPKIMRQFTHFTFVIDVPQLHSGILRPVFGN